MKLKANKILQKFLSSHVGNISYIANLDDFDFYLLSSKDIKKNDKRL